MSDRSFRHCNNQAAHPAHALGAGYNTVRYGYVARWCQGSGPGSIRILSPESPESLASWEYLPEAGNDAPTPHEQRLIEEFRSLHPDRRVLVRNTILRFT